MESSEKSEGSIFYFLPLCGISGRPFLCPTFIHTKRRNEYFEEGAYHERIERRGAET
jgi:hypothetical protein